MLNLLVKATCYHGALPHFLHGKTGLTIPFGRKDDGGDLVETALLMMGLLTARQYFDRPEEAGIRGRITQLWEEVEWNWYAQAGDVLAWHWSPNNGFAMNHAIRGWNETLVTYVLAAARCATASTPRSMKRLLRRPRLPQRQNFLWRDPAAGTGSRRAAVLRALFLLRP